MSVLKAISLPSKLAILLGCTHLIFMWVVLTVLSDKGSWGEVVPFAVDFPFSILFIWLKQYLSVFAMHLVLGSLWWALIGWFVTTLVLIVRKRILTQSSTEIVSKKKW